MAPKGNQFWKKRSKHGRDKIFASPEILWESACEYFAWASKNPWHKIEQTKVPAKPVKTTDGKLVFQDPVVSIPTERPFSMHALCLFLHVNTAYFRQFKDALPEGEEGFSTVIRTIEDVIYTQQLEGAKVGAFNANIVAREYGLREKVDSEVSGKDGKPIEHKYELTLNL